MKNIKIILLSFIFASNIFSEDIIISAFSDQFTIDTVDPEIELLSPAANSIYPPGTVISVTWAASDQSPAQLPIKINVSANLDNPYFELANQIPNTGSYNVPVPGHINSSFVSFRVDIVDFYGNQSYAYNEGYFTIGNPPDYDIVTTNFYEEYSSSSFIIDTEHPEVTWLSPNDQMAYDPGDMVDVSWEAEDETCLLYTSPSPRD